MLKPHIRIQIKIPKDYKNLQLKTKKITHPSPPNPTSHKSPLFFLQKEKIQSRLLTKRRPRKAYEKSRLAHPN